MEQSQPSLSDHIFSVTEFNNMVNEVLTTLKVWVQGEISGYRVSHNKWVTFDIKDKGSKLGCFMTTYQLDQVLEDGMEVKLYGAPRIYVPYGKYSFTVQKVEPVGQGALKRAFELTKQKLEQEGLFSEENKSPIPRFPEKIGVVSSAEAAAWTDFQRILENRWSGLDVVLRPSLVQGVNAPTQIVQAIEWFNKYQPVDVLVLTRGGGSLEDLQAFNSEQVCRAMFASKIPIVCGVGHERDITLAALVADVRASTPSNAAELVVPDKQEILWQLDSYQKSLTEIISSELERLGYKINEILDRLGHLLNQKISSFYELSHRLDLSWQQYKSRLQIFTQQAENNKERLVYLFKRAVEASNDKVKEVEKLLQSFNPKGVLKRGYSIIRAKEGGVVKSIKQVKAGQILQVHVSDGSFDSEVLGKAKSKEQLSIF